MNPTWIKYRKRILITFLVTSIPTIIRMSGLVGFTVGNNLVWMLVSFLTFLTLWEIFDRIHKFLDKKVPFTANITKRLILQFLGNWIVLVVLRWTGIYFLEDFITVKLNQLNYLMIIMIDIIISGALTLAIAASFFFKRWKENLIRNERLEKEKSQIQIHNLMNRMNPHFLFNSLSALDGLIKTQPELASDFLQHLSKVYRYSLQNENKEFVSLEREYEVFKHFVALLEIRYEKTLFIQIQLDAASMEKGIVPLSLELLTENALKHNEISEAHPLRIRIFTKGNFLCVENSIRRKKTMETSNKKGLEQLRNLYAYLSTEKFSISDSDDLFTVQIPLL